MQTPYFLMISVFAIVIMGVTMQLPTASSDSGSLTGLYAPSPDLAKMSLSVSNTFQQVSHNSTKNLHLEFFDAKNNTLIKNVSFLINATKDGKTLMYDLFYTHTGSITIKFSSGGDMGKWTVNGTPDPVLGGWMSENETLPVTISAFTEEGTYHIHLAVFALVYANGLVDQSNPPTFDSWWSVDDKGNISKYDNSTTVSSGSSVKTKDASPLEQFKSGINAADIKCKQDLLLVYKSENSHPYCTRPLTALHLMETGWGQIASPFDTNTDLLNSKISGGIITGYHYDFQSKSLVIKTQTMTNGSLTVTIPRKLLDARTDDQDDHFYVLMNGQEIDFTETMTTDVDRTLLIPFTNGTGEIEIIGAQVI